MQYGHLPLPERRDSNLDSNGSVCPVQIDGDRFTDSLSQTPFQSHQSLGQALGSHLPGSVGGPPYSRSTDNFRNLSTSPPGLPQPGPSGPSTSHSPLTYTVGSGQDSPILKRKQPDGVIAQGNKRRRDGDDGDSFDIDGTGSGAKHWTDEEKSKLFSWLMGPGQDDHWNSLRATKNSCLREVCIRCTVSPYHHLLVGNSALSRFLAVERPTRH